MSDCPEFLSSEKIEFNIDSIHLIFLWTCLIVLVLNTGNFSNVSEESEPSKNALFLVFFNLFLFSYHRIVKLAYSFKELFANKFFLSYIIFLGCVVLFRSEFISNARNYLNILLTYSIVCQLCNIMHSLPFVKLIKLLSNYLSVVLMVCLFFYFQQGNEISFLNHNPDYRFGGLFFFGTTAIIAGIAILFNVFLLEMNRKSIFIWLKVFFAFFILLATDTRMVIFSTIVLAFMIFFRFVKKSTIVILIISSILFFVYKIFIYLYNIDIIEESIGIRGLIWGISFQKISEKFLIGWGTENPFSSFDSDFITYLQDPHSAYLSLLLRQGFFSSILIFIYYFLSFKKYIKSDRALLFFVLYFFIVSCVGTEIFLGNYSFINILFNLTVFGLFMHPNTSRIYFYEETNCFSP